MANLGESRLLTAVLAAVLVLTILGLMWLLFGSESTDDAAALLVN